MWTRLLQYIQLFWTFSYTVKRRLLKGRPPPPFTPEIVVCYVSYDRRVSKGGKHETGLFRGAKGSKHDSTRSDGKNVVCPKKQTVRGFLFLTGVCVSASYDSVVWVASLKHTGLGTVNISCA